MVNRSNIMDIINSCQKEIDELRFELFNIKNESVSKAVKNRLSFLEDNQYRYKLQAKAWGIDI